MPPRISTKTRALLDRIIRVNHAGELCVSRVYKGQMRALKGSRYSVSLKDMWEQERTHLKKFEEILPHYRARPSFLLPFWSSASFALGLASGLMGEQVATACTSAIQSSIGEHYNDQIRELLSDDPIAHTELLEVLSNFRDQELQRCHSPPSNDQTSSSFGGALGRIVKIGSKAGIYITERI